MNGGLFMWKRLLCGCVAVICVASFTACGKDTMQQISDESESIEQTSASASLGYRETVLYYATDDGFMVPVMKMIPWEEGIGKAALRCLVNTPENRLAAAKMGLAATIPEGLEFSLRIGDNAEAAVDLSEMPDLGSREKEAAMITSIVNTLTEFPTIDTVSFTVNGKKTDSLPCGTGIRGAFSNISLNAEGAVETSAGGEAVSMTLFFPNQGATLNVPVTRYGAGEANIESAITALIEGPGNSGLRNCFPEGTSLLYADLFDGSATVNLSAEFLSARYTEGLAEAAYRTMFLTANAIEPIYELNILVEGKPFEFDEQLHAPVWANEF